ncbi:MAG: alpha-amylase [Candidatus Pacebacteria bacterium]|nr:alpha-amylase [Candidatus Paceibacterota bacterium]
MTDSARIYSIQGLNLVPSHPVYPSPADWRDECIYFLLVDRFEDGHARPAYDGSHVSRDKDATQGRQFQGGTLKGVTSRLSYIRGLGATTVWLSPILKNRDERSGMYQQGYAVQDFFEIDPRLGTLEDIQELVRTAHGLGMRVILDIIINHTGDNWAYRDDAHPIYRHGGEQFEFGYWRSEHGDDFGPDDAVWPAELQSPNCYKRRGRIVNWNDSTESLDGDFLDLKELDFGNPIVHETMQAIYKYWICVTDVDGYRIDTVKHLESSETATFCNAIKEYASSIGKRNFFLFGEVVADDATLRSYVGPRTNAESKLLSLDACLDFPLYFVLEEVIKGFASPHLLRERYARLRQLYATTDASEFFVTFVDNHDQMARPYRRFLHQVPDQRQAILALGYLLTAPGIPSIYYGTEQGFDGGAPPGPCHDTFIRECMFGGEWGAFGTTGMHFFNEDHVLYRTISAIAHLRTTTPALRYGRFYFREVSDDGHSFGYPALHFGMLAYVRILDDDEVLVVLNLDANEQTNYITVDMTLSAPGTLLCNLLDPDTTVLTEEQADRACARITLPGYGIALFSKVT